MKKVVIGLTACAALAAGTAGAGGWATVQLSSLPPDGAEAGATWKGEVKVLQHGRSPLDGVQPTVTIRNRDTGDTETVKAKPAGRPGVYTFQITFPSAGTWAYEVYDGFTQYGQAKAHTYKPIGIVGKQSSSSSAAWEIGGSAVLGLAFMGLVAQGRRRRPRSTA